MSFLRKTEGDREITGELTLGWEEVEWDEKLRKSAGILLHKAEAARWKDPISDFEAIIITRIIKCDHNYN